MLKLDDFSNKHEGISVVGLGYVGLPLAILLGKRFNVTGFDISSKRIEELKNGYDRTREVTEDDLRRTPLKFTNNPEEISKCKVIIIT
ncbi:MAG: nucleotide sugar dehydrogenase, partial [Nitrospirae bacterium]|nr:nucleotide sugar dehydrogenase [Nitrospirota bacterium]